MIVDTSALVAIAKGEADDERCSRALEGAATVHISAANLLEAYMVLDRSALDDADVLVDSLVEEFSIAVEPVTEAHVRLARDAFRRYGRGSHHPAKLNYGDCFAYALARETGEPLLFVGNDFGQTDIGIG